MSEQLSIHTVHVRRYKNLVDVELPWAHGVALFGQNGAGKTNLLECLALLLGTDETLVLAAPRLAVPRPGDLAVVMRAGPEELPWAPDLTVPHTQLEDDRWLELLPALQGLARERQWWLTLGVRAGRSFQAGLAAAGTPEKVIDLVANLLASPVIRYELSEVRLPEGGLSQSARRLFARTLLVADPPAWLAQSADLLPDLFAPLRAAVAGGRVSGLVPLLELPPSEAVPAVLQWLPRARSSEEAADALQTAFEKALPSLHELAEELVDLPVSEEKHPDPVWWLHRVGEEAARAELRRTLPHVDVESVGEAAADYQLWDCKATPARQVARTADAGVLDAFSAGERRWLDEALATIARAFTEFGLRAAWQAALLDHVDQDQAMAALLEVASTVEKVIQGDGYWSAEALDLVIRALDVPLTNAAQVLLAEDRDPLDKAITTSRLPSLAALARRVTVRVFDEPEAHLHPAAQRAAARALQSLSRQGQDIVVASHSPQFLGLSGWRLAHVDLSPAGSTVTVLGERDLRAGSYFSMQLGLTVGGLLASVSRVLLVEGQHDLLVLEALYGQELHDAAVAVLRMHGTDNLLATAEMDFVERYLHVPVHVMTDHTRVERIERNRPESDEEKRLVELFRALRAKKREYQLHGLHHPDIVAYLNDEAVRRLHPQFPGWSHVLKDFKQQRRRPSFKRWLADHHHADLTTATAVLPVLKIMRDEHLPPAPDLIRAVNELVAGVGVEADAPPV